MGFLVFFAEFLCEPCGSGFCPFQAAAKFKVFNRKDRKGIPQRTQRLL